MAVSQFYYRLFHHVEQEGVLNPLDSIQLYSLHYVYLPRINRALQTFIAGWNKHTISKTGGNSPLTLYSRELVQLCKSNRVAFDYYTQVSSNYGSGTSNDDEQFVSNTEFTVDIPPMIDLGETGENYLSSLVNPLSNSEVHAIDFYKCSVSIVTALLN